MAEEFGAFLLGGLCRIALSQMVRKETGFSIRELKQVYDRWELSMPQSYARMGHTVLHSRAEARLQRFSRLSSLVLKTSNLRHSNPRLWSSPGNVVCAELPLDQLRLPVLQEQLKLCATQVSVLSFDLDRGQNDLYAMFVRRA